MTGGDRAGTGRARVLAAQLDAHVGRRVRLCGFAEAVRHDGDGPEVVVRDHTGTVVLRCRGAAAATAAELVPESAIEATGVVTDAGAGGASVATDELAVPGPATAPSPLDAGAPLAQRLDWRYLDLRRPRNRLVVDVASTALRAMREFWHEHGFVELHSPKLRHVPNKGGDLFRVDYFDRCAYLVQSPQFFKQMAMAAGFDRVFEVGPAFRVEPAVDGRHATEFTSIDVELSWIDSDADLMAVEEALLVRTLAAVRAAHGEQIARWFGTDVRVPTVPFPRVRLDEAHRLVGASGARPTDHGDHDGDLDSDGERRLARRITEEHDHGFVFVTHYPEHSRPFYHMRCDDEPPATRSFDLLWKGLEITSGAQREHRHDRLVAQADAHAVPRELVAHFLDFFKHGCPPHGGFGLGLARALMSLLDVNDVAEVTFLFRGPDRLVP